MGGRGLKSAPSLVLSGVCFATAGMNALSALLRLNATTAEISAILNSILGIVAFVYWFVDRPDYTRGTIPVGIMLLAAQSVIVGLILGFEGLLLLFLPVLGIIGVFLGALGLGFIWQGKGLWEGREWALTVAYILIGIGIIAGVVGFFYGYGVPLLGLFELWYLRRPHIWSFFYGTRLRVAPIMESPSPKPGPVTLSEIQTSFPSRPLSQVCKTCGAMNPMLSMYCFNCTLRMYPVSFVPPSGQDEPSLRRNLERVQDELQKMNRVKEQGKIVDPALFENAYAERRTEEQELKARLDTIQVTPT